VIPRALIFGILAVVCYAVLAVSLSVIFPGEFGSASPWVWVVSGLLIALLGSALGHLSGRTQRESSLDPESDDLRTASGERQGGDDLLDLETIAASIAHDVREPLGVIRSFAEMLPDKYQDEEFRRTFEELVFHEVGRVNALLDGLLDLSRPSVASPKPVRISAVLERVLAGRRATFEKASLVLDVQAHLEDATVLGEGSRLAQVFTNLLQNAADACEPGGRVEVQSRRIRGHEAKAMEWKPASDELAEITVRDTGCGIPANRLEHVFKPFETTKENGVGLGLAITRKIVEDHGGRVLVESEEGKGTRVTVLLPLS
jgi:signal transduction histidine kinase